MKHKETIKSGVIGLLALSSLYFCAKSTFQEQENGFLKQDIEQRDAAIKGLEKTMARETEKNMAYRTYAEDAHMFLYGIRPYLSENDSGCEDPNCKNCQEMEKENEKTVREFEHALKVVHMDPRVLEKLQKGVRKID